MIHSSAENTFLFLVHYKACSQNQKPWSMSAWNNGRSTVGCKIFKIIEHNLPDIREGVSSQYVIAGHRSWY